MLVVDSSILIAYAIEDEPLHNLGRAKLVEWTQAGKKLAAPMLLRSELTSVVRRYVYLNALSSDQGRVALESLFKWSIVYHEDDQLMLEAYDIANEFNMPRAYDAQYLALTRRLSCELWTADKRFYNVTNARFADIHLLGDLS